MPVSLLDNQCCVKKGGVTLGAANGVGAIWLKPVVDGEPSVERGAIKYYPRPSLCLFVQLQDPARRCSRLVDGFPDGVVCCRPSNDTIEHPSVATTPDIAVHRRQISMMPRFAMTSYKSQGQTVWGYVVGVIGKSNYVMLSRCRSLSKLLLIKPQPPSADDINC